MKVSVYTSAFNLSSGIFNVRDAMENWLRYADEIVIASPIEEIDDVINHVYLSLNNEVSNKIIFVDTSIHLEDPFFDGKLKNAALQKCSNDIVIQQDLDERIGGNKSTWESLIDILVNSSADSVMIPVIDLYKDTQHYKSIGRKWYLHKNNGCCRGVVNFAKKPGGTIDTDKSDTCELINKNGNLVTALLFDFSLEDFPNLPIIFHYGYLNLNKRKQVNEFWQPVWSRRKGEEVFVETDIKKLENLECKKLPKIICQHLNS